MSSNEGYTKNEKANEEGNKLFYDIFKHLTTLNTGSILILVALLEKFFTRPQWKLLIIISLLSFFLSVLGSVLMMFFLAVAVIEIKPEASASGQIAATLISMGFFLIGVISFVVFAMKNFSN